MFSLDTARFSTPPSAQRQSSCLGAASAAFLPRCAPCRWRSANATAGLELPSTSYLTQLCLAPVCSAHRCRLAVCSASHLAQQPLTGNGKVGVVIVDHGSRKKASNETLVQFGQLYGNLAGHEIVEIAHMEIASPSVQDAIDACAARGATTVIVAPYFLSRGRHIQEDIPALVRQAAGRHPGLRCVVAEPIGIDPLMVQLISNRVAAALQSGTEIVGDVPASADVGTASSGSPATTASSE